MKPGKDGDILLEDMTTPLHLKKLSLGQIKNVKEKTGNGILWKK